MLEYILSHRVFEDLERTLAVFIPCKFDILRQLIEGLHNVREVGYEFAVEIDNSVEIERPLVFGGSMSRIASILSSDILTPLPATAVYPRKSTSFCSQAHFFGFK